ncbi:restriction endonuclease subunit S [Streptococcus parasanguinis]|jgi:restriction endonuclease S subunits family protein|uniref:restriction endonuclease subunit S n=1 Tax=Streptococcus parasanguinis TaxID=1318 RepID=UPI001D07F09D|nr:restriction endonuclease subunit S [Streptococcus parasanguinis]MCB6704497.1 restriction endonuclease subunit S [Streptococcus parasanguinis]MCB6739121.1 restriction endonuclease subunit S [Streptococcus parasanguinis]MCB7402224.1 restriction endonuclease subunit S [Streptococcus parasanguinis]
MTKQPSYRFAGYTESWVEKKLGEIVERITRKNKNLESDLPLTISAQYGLIDQETFFNKKVASKDVSGYYLLKKGEFAYNKSYSSDYPWGAVKRLDNYEMGVLSTLYIVFRPNSIDSDFLAVYYDSPKWYKEVSMRAAEGARNHGLLNISPQDFFDTELIFPVNQSEQIAIGSFFQDIDQLINLQQRKLEVLKEQKKTYLKLLFPAKGQTKPALRFAGFEDDWKEVKLGEILVERNEQISESEEYQLMSFVQGKGVVPKSDRYDRSFLVKDDKKNYKKTEYGDFIYSSNNLDTGSIGFNKTGKALISPVYSIFYSKTRKESQFIAILSQRKEFINEMIKYRQGVVYGQFRIHESDFLNISILAPESNEQEYLITFFQDLDKAIAKQEEKVNQLKESKQTLLRKMFI